MSKRPGGELARGREQVAPVGAASAAARPPVALGKASSGLTGPPAVCRVAGRLWPP